ncbi:MAG: peptidoglycan DD-metalloendopeptidase family protein [Rhodobacteraceae bacterium]|nr:peptidoglycan DD-metalloendopeptidase family protein [Paracoccaceae bacterium]
MDHLNTALERWLPEKRLFLRSENSTRYVRLRPVAQASVLVVATGYMAWSLVATSILFFEVIGSNDLRESARREQSYFETRLNEMSAQRDSALAEVQASYRRYGEAMDRVAHMQTALMEGEQRNAELARGIDALQATLHGTMDERDEAVARLAELEALDANTQLAQATEQLGEVEETLDFVLAALNRTADEREQIRAIADGASREAEHLALEYRLIQDRNTRIFTQLEQAVESSIQPLERMFSAAGLSSETLLRQVRAGYQTRSASLMPISISTSGTLDPASDEVRANSVLAALEEIDAYRIALQRTPFALPVDSVRVNSPFGYRRDPITGGRRLHAGQDFGGARGTPIHATADGVVSFAGRQSGYGNIVIIQHDFGFETRYGHLSSIAVREGQRVSRGDRIGGMGSTGRSTGTHLHYEIRVGGNPINPMTYIRAAQNVF